MNFKLTRSGDTIKEDRQNGSKLTTIEEQLHRQAGDNTKSTPRIKAEEEIWIVTIDKLIARTIKSIN